MVAKGVRYKFQTKPLHFFSKMSFPPPARKSIPTTTFLLIRTPLLTTAFFFFFFSFYILDPRTELNNAVQRLFGENRSMRPKYSYQSQGDAQWTVFVHSEFLFLFFFPVIGNYLIWRISKLETLNMGEDMGDQRTLPPTWPQPEPWSNCIEGTAPGVDVCLISSSHHLRWSLNTVIRRSSGSFFFLFSITFKNLILSS